MLRQVVRSAIPGAPLGRLSGADRADGCYWRIATGREDDQKGLRPEVLLCQRIAEQAGRDAAHHSRRVDRLGLDHVTGRPLAL